MRTAKDPATLLTTFSCHQCPHTGGSDSLFSVIEAWQGDRPWGRILDAGTGWMSLRWLLHRPRATVRAPVVAVTASPYMSSSLQFDFPLAAVAAETASSVLAETIDDDDDWHRGAGAVLVVGDWAAGLDGDVASQPISVAASAGPRRGLLGNASVYDTVLADYLVGAVDGFAPFAQDQVLAAVARHVARPGGRLYLTGMEPYPDRAATVSGQLVLEVRRGCGFKHGWGLAVKGRGRGASERSSERGSALGSFRLSPFSSRVCVCFSVALQTARLRDACILLVRDRTYREYPRVRQGRPRVTPCARRK